MEPESSLQNSQEPAICPYPEPDQFIPSDYLISWRSVLMLSSHLRLGLPSGFFPSGFPIKILYALLLFPIPATCRTHFFILDLITRIVFGSPLSSVFQSPVTSSLLNISVSSLFSNTLSVCFSLSVQDQVSRPQKKQKELYLCVS